MNHATAAKKFVTNYERAHWHDASLWFVRSKRDKASEVIPEWEELREAASQIKRHTLAHLADYLEQFTREAEARGVVIHWAIDAKEHNQIVAKLLADRGMTRLVKSKSMLTEECHLNDYLADRGVEVIDTDLGERIVQLRHETPSHIVLPAIHLKRQDVGQTFHDYLDAPPGLDAPDELTELARHHLREKLLAAEAGLTGVNFGIAETGGIVICTNEGNADLGTVLPKLHIASMGIEKLIPKAEQLAVFLRLLARSATGQPITSYSSHFQGPRPGGELHIILVDNGRTNLMASPEFHRALNCIRCGACLNTCPVYRRSGGHSYHATVAGPIGSVLGPSHNPKEHYSLPFACTLCGSCTDVCPVKIPLHHQLLAFRSQLAEQKLVSAPKRWSMSLASTVMRRPWLFAFSGRMARFGLRWLPRFITHSWLNTWARKRDLPEAPKQSFRGWLSDNRPQSNAEANGKHE